MDRRVFLANASALLSAAGVREDAPVPGGDPVGAEPAPGAPTWYDVTAFGASPEATPAANDTAIATALTAIPAAGGVLYIPTGTYAIATPITLRSNVLVQGDGMNATVLRQTTPEANGITLSGSGPRYLAVRDLKLVGPRSGTGIGVLLTTTSTSAVASCDLSRVYIRDFGSHGVLTNTLITSTLTDVRVQGCGGDGFRLVSGTSVALTSCYALNCTESGFALDSVTYATLVNCACDACGSGYHLVATGNTSLVACGCERPTGVGFLIDSGTSNSLLSCFSSGNNGVAFWLTGHSDRAALIGVRETAPGPGATASIRVDPYSTAFVVGPSTVTATVLAPNTTQQWTPTTLSVSSPGSATTDVDRATPTDAAAYGLATAGIRRWTLGLAPDSTDDLQLRNEERSQTAVVVEDRPGQPNLQLLGGTTSFGRGVGVIGITDARRAPSCDPVDGGILYVEDGALRYRGSRGTVTTIARA